MKHRLLFVLVLVAAVLAAAALALAGQRAAVGGGHHLACGPNGQCGDGWIDGRKH